MTEPSTKSLPRIAGLDSIRFLAALVVLLMHFNVAPSLKDIWPDGLLGWAIRGTVDNALNGQAAVIVFFVISGFCIHYPRVAGRKLAVSEFYASRYIRIALPMFVAAFVWVVMGSELDKLVMGILWSLYAELAYYTAYPLIVLLRKAWGWSILFGVSAAGSAAVIFTQPIATLYQNHGIALTCILGLPCWLLGCILAERVQRDDPTSAPSARSIWAWRLAIWVLSVISSALEFHSPIGAPITLNIFAVAVFFWLEREILWVRAHGPVSALEAAGLWSYSIYLMHLPLAAAVVELCGQAGISISLANPLVILTVLVGCYIFYRIVEEPSHRLAKTAARYIGNRRYTLRPL